MVTKLLPGTGKTVSRTAPPVPPAPPAPPRLARRAGSFAVSPWAAVDGLFDRHPDMIFFGNGAPAPELVPEVRLRAVAAEVWAREGDLGLGYAGAEGYGPLRE